MQSRIHVEIDSRDPFERGRQRGAQVKSHLQETWPIYQELFAVTALDEGRDPANVPAITEACLDSLSTWSPDLLRELEGVAAGSNLDLETVMAFNARTEILAQARGAVATECSTIVAMEGAGGSALGAQTWDWHHDLADGWHLHTVHGGEYTFVGLSEFGMLAKIGVNGAGLGIHFNLLRHASDVMGEYDDHAAPGGGVPVHLLAREVLGRAATVGEAIELIRSAPAAASTVITVLTPEDAACIEISPAGIGVVEPTAGWLVHTNHFLDPQLAVGERVIEDVTTTFERQELLRSRTKGAGEEPGVQALANLLCAHDEDGAAVCRHPQLDAPIGYRTATLATIVIDPSRREAHIAEGGPCGHTEFTTLAVHG